jgi:hypothetical protein
MNLTRLAAKQKRYLDIQHFTETEAHDPTVKQRLNQTLELYRSALAQIWRDQDAPRPESERNLESIERDLERLHNDARLNGGR